MAYKDNQETYIIDPENNENQPVVEKTMESAPINDIRRDYEVVEEERVNPSDKVLDEIHEVAVQEGLVQEDEEFVGGEGAKPDEVINALINKPRSEGAQKNQEKHEEQQIEKHRKIIATRDLLTGMTKKIITVEVQAAIDVKQPDGTITPEICDLEFKVQRLTESQSNHIFNKRMIGKKLSEMNREELDEENHVRSKYLAATVVDPKMTEEEWYEEVPNAIVYAAYQQVTEALNDIDNTSLFQ